MKKSVGKDVSKMSKSNPDAVAHVYNMGIIEGKKHSSPSPETKYKFEFIEHEIKDLKENISALAETGKQILEQVKLTNGRVNNHDILLAKVRGGVVVIKGIYGFIAVFLIAATYALFNMYVAFQNIDNTIRGIVQEEIQGAVLEEIK